MPKRSHGNMKKTAHNSVAPIMASNIGATGGHGYPPIKILMKQPKAIVLDLLGVLVSRSFMTTSREFKEFFYNNIVDYLNDNWKQKQLRIMINFFRCSQANVPDEYKLAERDDSREEQVKQAKRHIIWKHKNDPNNSALSLFMLAITEWGYKNKLLVTTVYDDVPAALKAWRELKIPIYVGVGSADFLVMVLTNTNHGNLLPYFVGHMNIMDFDGTRANKDFRKLITILNIAPDKILYLTRFRQDCRKALEAGLQSAIVLRPDFDVHNVMPLLRRKRGQLGQVVDAAASRFEPDGTAAQSPPNKAGRQINDPNNGPEIKRELVEKISAISLIDDQADDHASTQSSAIGEIDINKYHIILSLTELAFK
ncbi:Enolase-phosphatase E1 [Fragariocoptes setiger]|uniref:Enolase-phosphatase E1 n=1 Tax=Fragariocoptes setiger TaxID=1670756 RepID=A0ABQ7SD98_9ACAR|nr:Enolase-phosphatase E1 [Fragariocoptes setiger]